MVATRMGPGQRTTAVPTRRQPRVRIAALGVETAETAADGHDRRAQRERRDDADDHADRQRHAEVSGSTAAG